MGDLEKDDGIYSRSEFLLKCPQGASEPSTKCAENNNFHQYVPLYMDLDFSLSVSLDVFLQDSRLGVQYRGAGSTNDS